MELGRIGRRGTVAPFSARCLCDYQSAIVDGAIDLSKSKTTIQNELATHIYRIESFARVVAFLNIRPRSHVIYKQRIELARVRTSKRQLCTLSCSDHVESNSRRNDEEMTSNLSKTEISHTTRNKVSVERKISSKEILLPSGKENECPSAKNATAGGRKVIFMGDTTCRTQRISSSSNRGTEQSKERYLL